MSTTSRVDSRVTTPQAEQELLDMIILMAHHVSELCTIYMEQAEDTGTPTSDDVNALEYQTHFLSEILLSDAPHSGVPLLKTFSGPEEALGIGRAAVELHKENTPGYRRKFEAEELRREEAELDLTKRKSA